MGIGDWGLGLGGGGVWASPPNPKTQPHNHKNTKNIIIKIKKRF